MKQNDFPPGWDEERVQKVIDYYENQTEDEAVAEDEAGLQDESVTLMEIPNEPSRVLEKIQEIVEKSADGDYIYRGEPECHLKVSSNLYREYEKEIEADSFDIRVVQQEILGEAKGYLEETASDFEILTELQHHGGKTNLIDFTTDYLVALFFACDGSHSEPGRIILLENQSEVYEVIKPTKIINRVTSQKSIFVQAGTGFIDPTQYKVICIPEDLKTHMLDYLQKHHDISTKTIYNDLHGFIENRRIHSSDYTAFYKGMTCQNRGDLAKDQVEKDNWYEKSVEHYSKVLELNPGLVVAHNNRGLAYHKKGEIDNAIRNFNRVIAMAPYYTEGYANRGGAFAAKGEFDKAIADFKIALSLKNDFAEVYHNLGVAYEKKGEYDKAIENHNAAIELKPGFADAYYALGIVYREMGDRDQEFQNYTTAIVLKPNFVEALHNRGIIYALKGNHDKAIKDYDAAITLNQSHVNIYVNRGISYGAKGDWDKAIQDYSHAIELESDYADAYNNRGVAYFRKGDLECAIQDYNKAIELKPDYINAYANRGEAYRVTGDFERAIQDYNMVIKLKPDYAGTYNNRGIIYYRRGEYAKAIEDYNKGIEIKPDFAEVYCNRGEAWLHLRKWEEARTDLTFATNKGVDVIASFRNDYESVEDFEQKNGVELPEDIAAMLRQQ